MGTQRQPVARQVWTREGRIPLRAATEITSLGGTRDERITAMIGSYVESKAPHLREATRDVYERAYRRAGLLPGNPDDITSRLPPDLPSTPPAAPQPTAQPSAALSGSDTVSVPAETI